MRRLPGSRPSAGGGSRTPTRWTRSRAGPRREPPCRGVDVVDSPPGAGGDPPPADVVVERGARGRLHGAHSGCSPPAYSEYGYHHSLGAISVSTWTCLVSWKASRPSRPSSRPRPDCLKPPKGPASLSVRGSLNHTVPALISRMQRTIVFRSPV